MSIPSLKKIDSPIHNRQNEFGERALNFAPTVCLSNGDSAVPQQYLEVTRNLDNLSNVLSEISTPKNFQLFAEQDGSNLFLLVGVIGRENYASSTNGSVQDKIVYGRRWVIEDSTPTSEIIQTAMLAVKKAREHELRELLTVRINNGLQIATPFNCHLDLPLMTGNRSTMGSEEEPNVSRALKSIRLAGNKFSLIQSVPLGDKLIVEVAISPEQASCHFLELDGVVLTIVCEQSNGSDFMHQLMGTLIKYSDRYVEEQVAFKGFHRFSHQVDVIKLAEFSYKTRNVEVDDRRFDAEFADMSYRVDAAKAPDFNSGRLGQQQRGLLAEFDSLGGYLPR
jgi:hypothetical protein